MYIEFLIVFFPVLTMFLGLLQLAFLFAVRIAVDHAAVNAARTAAVVIGDDKRNYRTEAPDQVHRKGDRYDTIRRSAVLTLAPFIADGTITDVELLFAANDQPGDPGKDNATYTPINLNGKIDKVRVHLEVTALCRIMLANRIACGNWLTNIVNFGRPSKVMKAEAMFPYQGARYEYP